MISQTKVQTINNANDGVSIIQTAEGALQESTNILQRMGELASLARNDSNGTAEREALGKELNAMSDELTRIAQSTNLYGMNLLDGTAGVMTFQVGSNSLIEINLSTNFDATSLFVASGQIGLDDITARSAVITKTKADNALNAIDEAIRTIGRTREQLSTANNKLASTISNLQDTNEDASTSPGRVQETDFAAETAQLTKPQTLQQSATSALAQANQPPSAVLKLLQ